MKIGVTDLFILSAVKGLRSLAPDTGCRLGAKIGLMAYHLGLRRRVVADNVTRALGVRGRVRKHIIRKSYLNLGAAFLEAWPLSMPGGLASASIVEVNPLTLRKHVDEGGIVLTGHIGSWDALGVCISSKRPFYVYATAQHNATADRLITETREMLGSRMVAVRGGDRRGALNVIRALRKGEGLVGMLADQGPRPEVGTAAWFLGQPTYCHHGPVFIAGKAGGAPLHPMICVRTGAAKYRAYALRSEMVGTDGGQEAIQRSMDRLSEMIRLCPTQYFWHHRRFKYRADDLENIESM